MGTWQKQIIVGLAFFLGANQSPVFSQLQKGSVAPKFSAAIMGQNRSYEFAGDLSRPLIMFFWNPADEKIEDDLNWLNLFAELNKGSVEVISVLWEGNAEEAEVVHSSYSLGLTTVLRNPEIESGYGVGPTPSLIVIDKNNRVVSNEPGRRFTREISEQLTKLFLGALKIECNVPDATIYLNLDYQGVTSFKGRSFHNLKEGLHKLRVGKPGYKTYESPATVKAGDTTTVVVKLEPMQQPTSTIASEPLPIPKKEKKEKTRPKPFGSLVVRSSTDGAKVYLNNDQKGTIEKGEWKSSNIESGTYILTVIREQPYQSAREKITILPGKNLAFKVNWPAVPKPPKPNVVTSQVKPKTEPLRPTVSQPKQKPQKSWRPPRNLALGSYFGVFARYPYPMGILKDAVNQPALGFGATFRMMSRKGLSWDLHAEYFRLDRTDDSFSARHEIIPASLNMTIGVKPFQVSGGAGYYFLRQKAEVNFNGRTSVFKVNRDTWGVNGGIGIGFWRFEIGARYHYLPKNSAKNIATTSFVDIYGGIAPFYSQEPPSSESRKAFELGIAYITLPASATPNINFPPTQRSAPITEAKMYRAAIGGLGSRTLGWDLGAGVIEFGNRRPFFINFNLIMQIHLAPNHLALSCGGGGGAALLRQRFISGEEKKAKPKNQFFGQGFAGLRLTVLKHLCFYGDVGYLTIGGLSEWVDSEDSDDIISSDLLEYREVKFGGRWLRAGLVVKFFRD